MILQFRHLISICAALVLSIVGYSQKKPLDHTVYDAWESIQERVLSNNGKWVAFTVNPQEGDGKLILSNVQNTYRLEIPRAYNATISADSRWCVFKIKPPFAVTREARIRKKKPDDMPKDSLGWVELGNMTVQKLPRIKSFKIPEEGAALLAYHSEKSIPDTTGKRAVVPRNTGLDNALHVIDSLKALLGKLPVQVAKKYLDGDDAGFYAADADGDVPGMNNSEEGSRLVVKHLNDDASITIDRVAEYGFNKLGTVLWIKTTKSAKDSSSKPSVMLYYGGSRTLDTIFTGFNDARNFVMDDAGLRLGFVAERDSSSKSLQKFYGLFFHQKGNDSAVAVANRNSAGKIESWQISPDAELSFSKTGGRLFFGLAPLQVPRDTITPDFEKVSVDIWHYNDDYLQPVQLKTIDRELKRSYLAVYDCDKGSVVQLSNKELENVTPSAEGEGSFFMGTTNKPYRVASQWKGGTNSDLYAVDPKRADARLITKGMDGVLYGTSPNGNYALWYNNINRQFYTWSKGNGIRLISKGIMSALADEENDVPDDPSPYGLMSWENGDSAVYVYDRYDIWKLDPDGNKPATCITHGLGRKNRLTFRYQKLDKAERSIARDQKLLFSIFNASDKGAGLKFYSLANDFNLADGSGQTYPMAVNNFRKAKTADVYSYSSENFERSPDIKLLSGTDNAIAGGKTIFQPNANQVNYNWGTATLYRWKMFDGKMSEGLLYKPENFDSTKKYPVILYFYERNADKLHDYITPQPVRASINVSYYVSNGYIVFDPNIYYKTGQPGEDAYNSVVSAARMLAAKPWVDSTKMAIQGHSWGGYQVAYLLTRTGMFAAAEAGAPVANMTSAYGGIRWGSGVNRQFQYEKTQSRIGATLWQKPGAYLKNSPLFTADKITTPLLMMHNDQDDAVPWYQGIEFFTALRRLDKKVWLLNYNGELHGLMERKNRKDWTIRMQQFFDYYLKGAPISSWIKNGLPAIDKGKTMGLKAE